MSPNNINLSIEELQMFLGKQSLEIIILQKEVNNLRLEISRLKEKNKENDI